MQDGAVAKVSLDSARCAKAKHLDGCINTVGARCRLELVLELHVQGPTFFCDAKNRMGSGARERSDQPWLAAKPQ